MSPVIIHTFMVTADKHHLTLLLLENLTLAHANF